MAPLGHTGMFEDKLDQYTTSKTIQKKGKDF